MRPLRSLVARQEPWQPTVHTDLWSALEKLPAGRRTALLPNEVDGYTQMEVAQILGVPTGTVASLVAGAKAQLRKAMREVPR
jgi:RNA polymerase sigma factor (sigma-70 family)